MKKIRISFFALFAILCLSFSAQAQWGKSIKGEGPRVTKTLNLDDFSKIALSFGAEVHLSQGNKQKVVIKAQQNIIDLLDKEIRGDRWRIGFENKVNLKSHDGIDIYITLPEVEALSIAGSGSIIGETAFKNLDDLEISIAGSGDIELEGTGDDLEVSIAGSGDVKLRDFKVNDCEVSIAGSGDCEVHVDGKLAVSIAGSGDVKYKGSPDKVQSKVAGSGDVRSF
jgi:hypothetical protein